MAHRGRERGKEVDGVRGPGGEDSGGGGEGTRRVKEEEVLGSNLEHLGGEVVPQAGIAVRDP
jgi:hypothetical protein